MDRFKIHTVLLLLLVFVCTTGALRCRTEDGPSVEEIKKVVRTCMQRANHEHLPDGQQHGKSQHRHQQHSTATTTDSDEDYESGEYADESSDSNGSEDNNQQQHRRQNNNNNNRGGGGGHQQQQQGQQNTHQHLNNNVYDRNQQDFDQYAGRHHQGGGGNGDELPYNNRYGGNNRYAIMRQRNARMHSDGHQYQQYQQRGAQNQSSGGMHNSSNNGDEANGAGQMGACMVQCFFQELKMTNRDGQPDKHKMLTIMTRDIRDGQLREFYVDTIQECHRILEMEYARDKCTFARNLVTCMSERARSNCEDYQDSMLF